MDEEINLNAVYDKNLNFLIGSGASFGILPTLALKIRSAQGAQQTIETMATSLAENDPRYAALFMYYYTECIRPAQQLSRQALNGDTDKLAVLTNYRTFVETVLQILSRRKPLDKRCNVFTTNYDPCFSIVAEELLQTGTTDFVLNDGSRGFRRRFLQARNFTTYLCQTGIFERDQISIPQLNLIHLHGSVHWRKDGANILVDYLSGEDEALVDAELAGVLEPFFSLLRDENGRVEALVAPEFGEGQPARFLSAYQKLPIVNPTKWKFHETVFEEHYYQMLRLLSYELEKPNAVLIAFGFSFADEHILNLIKRSVSNPRLQIFICCFREIDAEKLRPHFEIYPNVRFVVRKDGDLTFSAFNSKVFSLHALGGSVEQASVEAVGAE